MTWWRLAWDALLVLGVFVVLEGGLRVEPVATFVAGELDIYENLLWYDSRTMSEYKKDLTADPNYDIWMLGSSYMMTALSPDMIEENLLDSTGEDITVQNLGFSSMRDLKVMARVVDRWLLTMDTPRYAVVAVANSNFHSGTDTPPPILSSQLESVLIFPDNIDELIARFLYQNSRLYRYGLLLRNRAMYPREEAVFEPRLQGGYVETESRIIDCSEYPVGPKGKNTPELYFYKLDAMLDVLEQHNIPALVVLIPQTNCMTNQIYGDFEAYQVQYIDPLMQHVRQRNIAVYSAEYDFYHLPEDERNTMYSDLTHAGVDGAIFLSDLTARYIADWLSQES